MSLFMMSELARYLVGEVRSGRTSTYGLLFEEYLANNILAEKYRGRRLAVVLRFVLKKCLQRSNGPCIDIVVRCHPSELPLSVLSNDLLVRLRQYSIAHCEPEYTTVMRRVDAEIEQRRESTRS